MKKMFWLFTLALPLFSFAQTIQVDTVYSTTVKDKYVITTCKPVGFSTAKKYHHVYMTDGGISIGDYVLGKSKSWVAVIPPNCVVISENIMQNVPVILFLLILPGMSKRILVKQISFTFF